MNRIPEADWKVLRSIRTLALQRLCRRILEDVEASIVQADKRNAHHHYLEIFQQVQTQDEEVAWLFDDWRRSTAITTLQNWSISGIMREEEFQRLSDETQAMVLNFREPVFYTRQED